MKNNQQTRILFITRAYGKHAGGMERLSYEMIQAVKNNQSIHADVLANETRAGISLLQTRIRSILYLITVAPKALLKARNYDVIHIGDPVLSKIGWLIKNIWRKPVVVTVHGLDVRYSNPIYKAYLTLFFKNFDAYIAISEHAKQSLVPWNVQGQVVVIPPGMSDAIYGSHYKKSDLATLLGTNVDDKVVLLTTGRLVPRKGHAWFIQNILPKLPSMHMYVIAGTGSEKEAITSAALNSGVSNRVVQLGRVSARDLRTLYNTADVYVQPNIRIENDAEGFGIVMLEAALCNRPVIASNIDGIPTAIHHEKNGYLVEPNNVNAWITAIESNSKPYAATAREYTLQTFAWEVISQQYITLFRQLSETAETA